MKKIGIVLGITLLSMFLIFFFSTCYVERTSFYDGDYYQKTAARIDSVKSAMVRDNDSLQAGFAKVSITPGLQNSEDNFSEGKFIQVPLAGFGARKGKAATGVHDSIFVKAVALKVNNQTLAIVCADLLIMPPNIIDSVTALLSKEGIQRGQLFFSATHTHSSLGGWGSGFIGEQFAGKESKNIEKWLVNQIKNALAAKGFKANVTSFNGSYVGYIIPGRYFYLDEYESKLMGWFGPNMGEYTMDLIRKISDIITQTEKIQ